MLHSDSIVQCAMGISITEVYNLESENRNGSCHFGELAACTNGTLLKVEMIGSKCQEWTVLSFPFFKGNTHTFQCHQRFTLTI